MRKTGDYDAYLKSSHWRTRRASFVKTHGSKCARCSSRSKPHVHHMSYDRVGNEPDSDLIVLCERCHSLVHAIHGKCGQVQGAKLSLRQATRVVIAMDNRNAYRVSRANPSNSAPLFRQVATASRALKKQKVKSHRKTVRAVRIASKTSPCANCEGWITPGDEYHWNPKRGTGWHAACNRQLSR